jgi:hypothetical protein
VTRRELRGAVAFTFMGVAVVAMLLLSILEDDAPQPEGLRSDWRGHASHGCFPSQKEAAAAHQLRRRRPKGGKRSLRDISAELAARGHLNERGVPFSAASINSMLQAQPRQP